jgi:hypothetical protein
MKVTADEFDRKISLANEVTGERGHVKLSGIGKLFSNCGRMLDEFLPQFSTFRFLGV